MLAELRLNIISRHNYLDRHELRNCHYFTFVLNGKFIDGRHYLCISRGIAGNETGGISQARPRRDLRPEGPLPDQPDVELSG
jgi:hypothetical protein